MTIVRKAALFCDGCGKRVELDGDANPSFSAMLPTAGLEDWREFKAGKHLCPGCAGEYADKEREFQRQLDAMLGIDRIEFDL